MVVVALQALLICVRTLDTVPRTNWSSSVQVSDNWCDCFKMHKSWFLFPFLFFTLSALWATVFLARAMLSVDLNVGAASTT